MRWRDAPNARVSWQASVVRDEEAGHFCKVAVVPAVAAGSLRSEKTLLTVDSRVA